MRCCCALLTEIHFVPQPGPPPATPIVPPITPPACKAGEKPVQVFIGLGQSNMLGEGEKMNNPKKPSNTTLQDAVFNQKKFPYLEANGNWSTSKTVRDVFVMASGGVNAAGAKFPITLFHNEFMTGAISTPKAAPWKNHFGSGTMAPRAKPSIGPELGIGGMLEQHYKDEPVMWLKSCIGNRALGWDLLPPTQTQRQTFGNYTYAAYHESPMKWLSSGPKPKPINWVAGLQYDGDVSRANAVLNDIPTFYPGKTCYEVAGFFWWQGDKDSRDMGLSTHYEANLVAFIKQLRVQFGSPKAKFVTASLGQTAQGAIDGGGRILDAMEHVADGKTYPEFKGNVAAVYTHPLENTPGSSGGHYGGDAITYMNIGEAMGKAMTKMLAADKN